MPGPTQAKSPTLPPIPSKHYFTIGEVSSLCEVKPHVLRYWEQEFDQLKPVKRRGNRRYYQPHEVQLIRDIRGLLYDQGFTISGARAILDGKTTRPKLSDAPWSDPNPSSVNFDPTSESDLSSVGHPHSNEIGTNPLHPPGSVQHAMAALIGGMPKEATPISSFDLPALKRELQSIVEFLQSE